jgi:hypothetical protein
MTLLVAGLTGNVFVYGQVRLAPRLSPFPSSPVLPGQKKIASDSIVVMWPDNMRCLVPSLAELEPMPVRRPIDVHSARGYDPMPNGFPSDRGRPWLQVVPRKRPQ